LVVGAGAAICEWVTCIVNHWIAHNRTVAPLREQLVIQEKYLTKANIAVDFRYACS
jgi:hypothetical protein